MSEVIRFVLSQMPALLFIAALVLAFVLKRPADFAGRLLDWLLLLPVGVESLWAGLFHIFLPNVAAQSTGWTASPFQFEIGVADAAIGVVAIVSFWRSLNFKAAVIGYIVLFNIGVAIGHVHQAMSAGNFSANNFGLLLALTIVDAVLLPILYVIVRRRQTRTA
jgi:hypothetical protein